MRRFILVTLIPLSDAVATGVMMVMLNGIAWVMASVCLLPENATVEGLALIYAIMALVAGVLTIGFITVLVVLALIYRVPLGPIFLSPDKRAELLQEATV